ncbi:MAG: glutathione S-transferase family protein [Alphaproteobacteria bacterium]|nr:glutathione S-transferase family protein [Alphaproteobacteria bacterium]
MVLLIHHTTSPFSRKIRLQMSEKKVLFVLKEEEPWNLSEEVYQLNPSGSLPIFLYDGNFISGNYAISEYLEDFIKEIRLLPDDIKQRADARNIIEWFDTKFYEDVYKKIVVEKVHKRFSKGLAPDSKILKIGLNNLNYHMEYIDWLAEKDNYLAGETFSLADITAAAHLSIIDYLGDVSWENYRNAKIWYSKIKSRPSFKDLLNDTIRGILPSKHYANLDF